MTRQALLRDQSVQYVKGVGPARAAQLARLGIRSVEDLLWTVPRRYEDRTLMQAIDRLQPDQLVTVRGRLLAKQLRWIRGGRSLLEADVGDDTGTLQCLWFNQPYLDRVLQVGEEVIVHGRLEGARRLQLMHPEIERLGLPDDGPEETTLHMGRIVPIYPLTGTLGQRWFRRTMHTALAAHAASVIDLLPAALRDRHHLPEAPWAVQQVHFPESWEAMESARRRLVFEEFFLMQTALALRRARFTSRRKPQRYRAEGPLTEAFECGLPFAMTASQQHVLQELIEDLRQLSPMLRLLQGDVGCGKTIVAAAVMAVAVQSGYQAALMAPTELLAEQHARVLRGYFGPLGVTVRLLSQGVDAADRMRLLEQIASGAAGIVVGTHALLEASVQFANLALVVVDEQHKFGVVQRKTLVGKAQMPDVLVMTATPIPRTLALSLYGDLAVSTITELPPGRPPVQTRWMREAQRGKVYQLIRDEVRRGRQGYVVYPLVEASEASEIKAATEMAEHLQRDIFPDLRVELLHGQMRSSAKEAVMRAFLDGAVDLLVSTVIVEVGLDVPNATIMLIEHPERFGLAQLHQLRGRIGRSWHSATCLLIGETADEIAGKRLAAFVETTDGFALAQRDLDLRGPGELLGRRQHGWFRFRVADLATDQPLLELARHEAFDLVARDPQLADPALEPLKQRLSAGTSRR